MNAIRWVLTLPFRPFLWIVGLCARREIKRLTRENAELRMQFERQLASLPPEEATKERASFEAELAEAKAKLMKEPEQ